MALVSSLLLSAVVRGQARGQPTRALKVLRQSLFSLKLFRALVGGEVVVNGIVRVRRMGRSSGHLLFGVLGSQHGDFGQKQFPGDGRGLGVIQDGPDGDLRGRQMQMISS